LSLDGSIWQTDAPRIGQKSVIFESWSRHEAYAGAISYRGDVPTNGAPCPAERVGFELCSNLSQPNGTSNGQAALSRCTAQGWQVIEPASSWNALVAD
jgi:hypothetical protein